MDQTTTRSKGALKKKWCRETTPNKGGTMLKEIELTGSTVKRASNTLGHADIVFVNQCKLF